MNVKIRKATPNDLDELISMGTALHDVEKKFEPLLTFSNQEAKKLYSKQLENKNAFFLVAEKDEHILGYLYGLIDIVNYFSTKSPEAEIEVIYLKPESRGKGVAELFIDKFVIWAKEMGAFRVKAGIYEENDPSKNLFLKYGFKPYHTVYNLDINR